MQYQVKNALIQGSVFGMALAVSAAFAVIINPLPFIFQNGTTADATQINADLAQVVNNVNSNALSSSTSGLVPSNAVMAFNLPNCPTGWLPSNGSSAQPDMRGYFPRGIDTGGGVDPGRTLGDLQQDQVQSHSHNYLNETTGNGFSGGGNTFSTGPVATATTGQTGNAGTETRPKNRALLYCTKT